jgi:hypothetical protein
MPQLIKNIEAEELQFNTGSVQAINSISGIAQEEDYINMFGFVAYLQNFTKVEETVLLNKPLNLGLNNKFNLPINNLEIDY